MIFSSHHLSVYASQGDIAPKRYLGFIGFAIVLLGVCTQQAQRGTEEKGGYGSHEKPLYEPAE
jgi:hypothetical protein